MRRMIHIGSALVLAAILVSCKQPDSIPLSCGNTPSSAFFAVPAALSADQSAARTAASDGWVSGSVRGYYEYVRGQVRLGARIAASVKGILESLEAIEYGTGYLLDSGVNATVVETSATYKWTSKGGGAYLLEKWNSSNVKLFELDFTRSSGRYFGTAIASGLVFPAAATGAKNPDMISVVFDSANPAKAGAATLLIKASKFRVHPDLAIDAAGVDQSASGQEDIFISLAKDLAGTVTLGSIAKVENSRHFVWNGYNYAGALNTAAAPETRYYAAAGSCGSTGLATVHLGIPATFGTDVFTNNGIGSLVAKLLTDRLDNDYSFDASGTANGYDLIGQMNLIPAVTPKLDAAPTYANTPAAVAIAVGQAKTYTDANTPNNMIDYLNSMMAISNPAYFDSTHYTAYGATPPATGYPALTDTEARALLPVVGDVDALASGASPIAFANNAAP